MTRSDFYYESKDGEHRIHAVSWIPDGEVKGVLQIAHGMVEFIMRYDRFAAYMADHGYAVFGNDHLGHGLSVNNEEELGFFHQPNGNYYAINDMHRLYKIAHGHYPDLPHFLLGHSMGSFFAREYIELFGKDLAGAIIMGTGYQSAAVIRTGRQLCDTLGHSKGWTHRSLRLADMVLGSNNSRFEPARTRNDWLTKDEAIVDAYNENPLNNFKFTVNGYQTLFDSIAFAHNRKHIAEIPKNLPLYFVSGADDPVGNYGKGVAQACALYQKAGMRDITFRLYEDDRHEILNELDYQKVYSDILYWIERKREDASQS